MVIVAAVFAQVSQLVRAQRISVDGLLFVVRTMLSTTAFSGFFFALSTTRAFHTNPDNLFAYEMLFQKLLIAIACALLIDYLLNSVSKRLSRAKTGSPR